MAKKTIRITESKTPKFAQIDLRSNIQASLKEGTAFSLMVGLGETYFPAFVIAMGLGEVIAGLVTTIPLMVGSFLQLGTPYMVYYLKSYRKWVLFCVSVQGATFLSLIVAALVGHLPASAIFLITAVYFACGLGAGPAWNAWMGTIIPKKLRPQFFGRRTRMMQVGSLIGFLLGGFILQKIGGNDSNIAFVILFFLALVARIFSVYWLSHQEEPEHTFANLAIPTVTTAVSAVSRQEIARFLLFVLIMQFGVYVASPYFSPYMLGQLKLDYFQYTVLITTAYIAKVFTLPQMVRLARQHGGTALIWAGCSGIVLLPGLWLISHSFYYLIFVQFLSGVFWSAFELAHPLLMLETIPDKDRTNILTLFNFANSIVMVLGSVLGGALLESFHNSARAYAVVFASSVCLRLISLWWLRCYHVPKIRWAGIFFQILSLRPTLEEMASPVVATLRSLRRRPKIEVSGQSTYPKKAA